MLIAMLESRKYRCFDDAYADADFVTHIFVDVYVRTGYILPSNVDLATAM